MEIIQITKEEFDNFAENYENIKQDHMAHLWIDIHLMIII